MRGGQRYLSRPCVASLSEHPSTGSVPLLALYFPTLKTEKQDFFISYTFSKIALP